MQLLLRSLFPTAALLVASVATAQEARFLEWNIQMSTPRLQSGPVVKLKNLKRPGKVVGSAMQAVIDIMHAGINLEWVDDPSTHVRTNVVFEIENPGKTTPLPGPISYYHKVAIKVGQGLPTGSFGKSSGGYLKCQDTRFGIDMNFSPQPSYEWHVITFAPPTEGITKTHKVALLNTKKRAFLVYQGRTIGFELGWWRYFPPLPVQVTATAKPGSPYYGYKSNIGEILPFLEKLDKVSPGESRFLRSFFGIKRT